MRSLGGAPARGIVFNLSRADLVHEWILTLCLIMAVSAVLAPLLILFGLKFGTIELLRFRLVEDPRNREIRPMISRSFQRDWFDTMKQRSDVSFVIPATRQISATVDVKIKGNMGDEAHETHAMDIIPTGQGDRLLLENGAAIPGPGFCVLTQAAAATLGVEKGRILTVATKRLKANRYEKGEIDLVVSDILSDRAGTLKSLYVPLDLLEAVEHYKDGQAVPEYGWQGTTPRAYPLYDGLVLILAKPLNKIDELKLITNTGFSRIESLTPRTLQDRAGVHIAPGKPIYLLSTGKNPARQDSVQAVAYRLRGKDAVLIPWVNGLRARIIKSPGSPPVDVALFSLSVSAEKGSDLGLFPIPPWPVLFLSHDADDGSTLWRRIMVSEPLHLHTTPLQLTVNREAEGLTFPVQSEMYPIDGPTAGANIAFVPARLAGVLNLFRHRNLTYDDQRDEFVLSRRGYAGFRLYANTIDDVDSLKNYFESQGIPVHTQADRIRDVTELDTYLSLIFWLIATVGVVGGVASLMASLYASVERKRRDLSILRLIGLSGAALFRFPIYQGILIAVCGFGVALCFFQSVAWVINFLFQDHFGTQESLCRLAGWHIWACLAGTMAVAVMAGGTAAWRVTRIEPAEALRDE